MAAQDMEHRLREMPEDLRRQVIDYMEFLLSKYRRRSPKARNVNDRLAARLYPRQSTA